MANRAIRSLEDALVYHDDLEKRRNELPWEVDGVVVRIDLTDARDRLGATARHPRWAVAWKFVPREADSAVRDIVVQVGRTGVLTPVALFDPVSLRGVTVGRATLHNADEIARKDVRVGDTVRIARAGDVIPEVVARVPRPGKRGAPFRTPDRCTACGARIVRDRAFDRCPAGLACPAQLVRAIVHFASRDALDIAGLGRETAERLVESGAARSVADVLSLREADLLELDRFAPLSAHSLVTAIERAKTTDLARSHNIAVRKLGLKRGLKISEYGVFRGARRVGGRTEEEVFRAVELPWIPPELREDHGEIEAAREGRLPELVRLEDLRGDLHMHTNATDGVNTLREMVEACAGRGYEYLAITDHTKAVRVAGGLDRTGFRRQRRAIDALRQEFPHLTILHGAEVDILPDGTLDLEDDALAELGLVVAAVHSKLAMPEQEMTERILRALAHPRIHVQAHPTGRLLGKREPYAVDLAKVVRAARDHSVLLEINAQPERLDLCDVVARMARDCGAKLVVSTDAHRVAELDFVRYGIDQARRGWCCPSDIANTRSLEAFRAILRQKGREADGASRTPAKPPGGHARTRAASVRVASSRASPRAAR